MSKRVWFDITTDMLEKATDNNILASSEYNNELYRLAYTLKRLLNSNSLYIDLMYEKDPHTDDIKYYNLNIRKEPFGDNYIENRTYYNEEDLIKDLKELIKKYYKKNQSLIDELRSSVHLTDYCNTVIGIW